MKRTVIVRSLLAVLIVWTAVDLHQRGLFRASFDWVERIGPWSPVLFVGVCVVASILFVPSVAIKFGAGVLFGLGQGIPLCLIGHSLGSVSAFLIGRYVASTWTARAFADNRMFRLMSEMIRRKGWRIVVLARLSPVVPFTVGNYVFGLTPISAGSYWAATVIGSIPSTSVYVYLGALSRDVALPGNASRVRTPLEWGLVIGGLAVTVCLVLYLKRLAQRELRKG